LESVITFEHFKKSYGTKEVHRDISFEVRKGECLGLIGGSGQGKSVILRSIIGLEKPDAGTVNVLGTVINDLNDDELTDIRKACAYVFQGGALFDSMTVYENLAYPLRAHTSLTEEEIAKSIKDLLSDFGLDGNQEVFPANLSGGMQKRVGLARAIIMNPSVILYDEPTAGLDPHNTKVIQDLINRLKKKGVTSILVTHDMPTTFAVCDRICFLLNGRIIETGTLKELESRKDSVIHRFINGDL
jgi:phospholipid/cholesterol/gamma-HCH transport system ATP-binding protein